MTNRDRIKNFGYVSRMDNLQAAVLNFRLKNLKSIIKKRRKNAEIYSKNLNKTFVVQVSKRDKLKRYLKSKGIETSIHYPIPIHLQPALKKLKYKFSNLNQTEKQSKKIITLPINQFLKETEIKKICFEVNNFYENI